MIRDFISNSERYLFCIILLYIFTIPLSYIVSSILLLIGIFIVFIEKIIKKNKWIRTKLDLPLLIFVVMVIFSIIFSVDPGFSFYNAWNLVGRYVLSYILIVQGFKINKENLYYLIGIWILSGISSILYGYLQAFWGIGIDFKQMNLWTDSTIFSQLAPRIYSWWYNPNLFAGYLDIFIGLIAGFILTYKNISNKSKFVFFSTFIFSFICLGFTYARGGIFSILLSIFLVLGYYNRKFLLFFILGLICYLAFDSSLVHRLSSVFSPSLDSSANMRIGLWLSTIEMIKEHFLFGIGWGAYYQVYPSYDYYMQGHFIKIVHAHNMYLNILAEIGLLGGFAFFWMYFGTIFRGFTIYKNENLQIKKAIGIGFSIGLLAMAFNGLTDYVLFNVELSELIYIIMALLSKIQLAEKNI